MFPLVSVVSLLPALILVFWVSSLLFSFGFMFLDVCTGFPILMQSHLHKKQNKKYDYAENLLSLSFLLSSSKQGAKGICFLWHGSRNMGLGFFQALMGQKCLINKN